MGEEEGRRKRLGEFHRTKRPDVEPLLDLSAFMNDRFFFGDKVSYPPISSRNRDLHEKEEEAEDKEGEEEEEEEGETKLELNRKSIHGRENGASLSFRTQEWLEEARKIVSTSPAMEIDHLSHHEHYN